LYINYIIYNYHLLITIDCHLHRVVRDRHILVQQYIPLPLLTDFQLHRVVCNYYYY